MSSTDTIKLSYQTCRKSKYSLLNSEKSLSYCMNTLSKNATLRTENDREISNFQNFYIVTQDITSTKKEAFKVQPKHLTDDIEVKEDLNTIEEELIFEEEKQNMTEKEKLENKNNPITYHSSISTQHESVKVSQKFEFFMQIDLIYMRFFKEIEEKRYALDQSIESWFTITSNSIDMIYQEAFIKDDSILPIIYSQTILEVIIFGILFNRPMLSEQLKNGLKNCLFYLHQNLIIILFIMLEQAGSADNEWAQMAKKKVEENKTWLNKHIYKKLSLNNINLISGIIKNLINSVKQIDENNIEDQNNLDIVSNYLKQFNIKNPNLKDTIISLREYIYSHFVVRKRVEETDEARCAIKEPFLPARSQEHLNKPTLVLDLDETLVHYVEEEESAYILIRPGAENFLEELYKHYELVIFTAATQDYADFVLNELDKNKRITHRLYRQHTCQNDYSNNIKDLSKLGREINKLIIIDNVKENFQLQKENGLHIKDFYDDVNDTELIDILPDLINVARMENDDIRPCILQLREKMALSRERNSK